ncbi:MAG: glycosyltransferase family 2 protein [Bacteroidetes bacterium]|nr:glycosyltransferase family 2 protein [Bacteroidota bacterium]
MEKPLVSIIIPTYNRAHLIGETLDSIIAQTYTNWECIVVDDGSTDNTDEVMAEYVAKDTRFKYHKRPDSKPKGANACRNIGFEKAKGEYVNWFDSDDIMYSYFIQQKIELLQDSGVDFVVSKCMNFNDSGVYEIEKYKNNSKYALTGKNYIMKNVYWITQDFMIKRDKIKEFKFNEYIQSGQETNFFIILLNSMQLSGVAIDEVLSLRRIHDSSIQQKLKKSEKKAYHGKLLSLIDAYMQIHKNLDKETKHFMQSEIITVFYKHKLNKEVFKEFVGFTANLMASKNPLKAAAFFTSMMVNATSGGGYKLFEFSRK